MKKVIGSLVVAGLISSSAVANECATTQEKIGFGLIGIAQGFIIGGPIGAFWGLGTVIYANNVDDCGENKTLDANNQNSTTLKNEETITLLVQTGSMNQEAKENKQVPVAEKTNLDEIKTVQNPQVNQEAKQTFKEVNSFVNFGYDRFDFKTVNTDLKTLNLDNASEISIQGHTDSKGTDEYNFALGLKRANSVKAYLIKNNISKDKISVTSFGEVSPISNVDAKNRRVDLKITYK